MPTLPAAPGVCDIQHLPGHAAVGCVVKVTEQLQGVCGARRVVRGLVAAWLRVLRHPPHGRARQDFAVGS